MNEKKQQYERIAFFIIVGNVASFVLLAFTSVTIKNLIFFVFAASVICVCLFIDYFLSRKEKNVEYSLKIAALTLITIVWFNTHYWWIGFIFILLQVFYSVSKRHLLVTATKDKIIYPSFPQKNIQWLSLNNVILKDGLLTIDLKNNKLIQQSIDESKTSVNEREFNDFCREQLSK